MDVVHFAETHGHDQDRIRPNAWPYRDYLIESFNARQAVRAVRRGADRRRRALSRRARRLTVGARLPRRRAVGRELADGDIRDDSVDTQDRPLPRPRRHGHDGHVHVRQHAPSTAPAATTTSSTRSRRQEYYGLQAVFAGVDRAEPRLTTPTPRSTARGAEPLERGNGPGARRTPRSLAIAARARSQPAKSPRGRSRARQGSRLDAAGPSSTGRPPPAAATPRQAARRLGPVSAARGPERDVYTITRRHRTSTGDHRGPARGAARRPPARPRARAATTTATST